MTDEQGYNGWKNYETWVTALWIDNDQGTYNYAREVVAETLADADVGWPTMAPSGTIQVADALKEWAEEAFIDPITEQGTTYPTGSGLHIDLLRSAWGEVDWYEIAENYISEQVEA